MNEYRLVLFPDGDIAIFRGTGEHASCLYHRTYNVGDDIKMNLLMAYNVWKDLDSYDR